MTSNAFSNPHWGVLSRSIVTLYIYIGTHCGNLLTSSVWYGDDNSSAFRATYIYKCYIKEKMEYYCYKNHMKTRLRNNYLETANNPDEALKHLQDELGILLANESVVLSWNYWMKAKKMQPGCKSIVLWSWEEPHLCQSETHQENRAATVIPFGSIPTTEHKSGKTVWKKSLLCAEFCLSLFSDIVL